MQLTKEKATIKQKPLCTSISKLTQMSVCSPRHTLQRLGTIDNNPETYTALAYSLSKLSESSTVFKLKNV